MTKIGINSTCGKQKVLLEVPDCNIGTSNQGEDLTAFVCKRPFYLYIPSIFCDEKSSTSEYPSKIKLDSVNNLHAESSVAIPSSTLADTVPLVFSLHCYGCTYETMEHWTNVAEEYKFILVLPEGIKNSWNARYCCGYALEENIDDHAFLSGIIDLLSGRSDLSDGVKDDDDDDDNDGIIELFPFKVSKDYVYAVGWSNGGYMVTYAADLFRAIAPISGHQYESSDFPVKPTSLFMHHGTDDNYVRPAGCCTDPTMRQCCCGISAFIDQCNPISDVFERWAKEVNQCETDENGMVKISEEKNDGTGITCYKATGSCLAETKYCMHQNKSHFNVPSFEKAFPMSEEIADFFATDACSQNKGVWNSSTKSCDCADGGNTGGLYCATTSSPISSKSVNTPEQGAVALLEIGSTWLFASGIVVLFIVYSIFIRRR